MTLGERLCRWFGHRYRGYDYRCGDGWFMARICPRCGVLDWMRLVKPEPQTESPAVISGFTPVLKGKPPGTVQIYES